MRPRRSPSLGLVLATSLILAIPAQADLCSRLPRWAEASCGFLGGWFGAVAVLAEGPAMDPGGRRPTAVPSEEWPTLDPSSCGRMEAAPKEEGPAIDPWGRSSAQAPEPPVSEPASDQPQG